jgi:hypothetical protein
MNVIHLRTPSGARAISASPIVFTPERVNTLGTLNTALRWLRQSGVQPLSINLLAEVRPAIVVGADAAAMLIKVAHGFACHRKDGEAVGSVTINGCTILWRFQEAA